MTRSDSGGEDDVFFDACDDDIIRGHSAAEIGSSLSPAGCTTGTEAGYELWAGEPTMSVRERRQRFLKGMGFLEPGPTGAVFPQWLAEITTNDCSFHDLEERISSICSSFRSCFSDGVLAETAAPSTRDMDNCNGRRSAARDHEGGGQHNVLSEILEEVGSDEILAPDDDVAGSSPVARRFLRSRSSGRSHASGDPRQGEFRSLWGSFRRKKDAARAPMDDVHARSSNSGALCRTKVHHQNKKWMDFTAVYMCQEIQAHEGLIRVMKFSSSGWHLASGGEDCVVRVWQITEIESSANLYVRDPEDMDKNKGLKTKPLAIIPNKVFSITETPLHEFHGHGSDILDLAWSKSDFLLSSSKDTTIRMWKVGWDDCLAVFRHGEYVTCVDFNPVDERYFVSGSIDGKVRVWDVSDKRVVDWDDIKDIITAISYQPDGKGFVVGSVKGKCRFYDQSGITAFNNFAIVSPLGKNIERGKLMRIKRRKWFAAANRITNIQFSKGHPSRMIIASKDHKIRVYEGLKFTQKFQGQWKSKALVPPSLTPDGRYLISAGSDSNVRIWSFDGGRRRRAVCSRELFFSEGVTAVAPWERAAAASGRRSSAAADAPTLCYDRERCSFGTWFLAPDGPRASAATWPEEKLLPSLRYVNCAGMDDCRAKVAAAWNTVVVTGSRGGAIRAFHNYGLPVRL
ncbi:uncharacterized WD repeat-containing protein C3H5.08c-like [Oryza brachyantha]|uniref:uncharacterized WD repeat-containing protein C3H5.08c-like n=1 Tax=Oryza brachyantha TaxID=4533 RepID=UPI0003EAB22E|nr:uncharacterized WD repeat-containing protein C3H5.08c-like [Oryza brachyantha]